MTINVFKKETSSLQNWSSSGQMEKKNKLLFCKIYSKHICMCACLCLCVCVYKCIQLPLEIRKGAGFPGTGVACWEPTRILCKKGECSSPVQHLFSP